MLRTGMGKSRSSILDYWQMQCDWYITLSVTLISIPAVR